jgi:thioesterase domain-containing protein
MKYQYFIASRWRNRDSVFELTKKLRQKGKTVYCFMENDPYHSSDDDPEEVMKAFESTKDWKKTEMLKEIFKKDMDALVQSETLLLLLPAGKSAHIESGAAYGMKKKCILIGEQKKAESLYLIFNEDYPSIDAFIANL